MLLSWSARWSLSCQKLISFLTWGFFSTFSVVAMRYWRGYQIVDHQAVRQEFKKLCGEHKAPLLICANHLTMIDSPLIVWALASNWTYAKHFRLFPWNMPEWRNFGHIFFLRFLCYLGKCLPVIRGTSSATKVLYKFVYLLKHLEAVFLFPEGTRSRTGIIDPEQYSYGPGRLLTTVQDAEVLLVYFRGYGQTTYSNLPKKGEKFYCALKLLKPADYLQHTQELKASSPLRLAKQISKNLITELKAMEQTYFSLHR